MEEEQTMIERYLKATCLHCKQRVPAVVQKDVDGLYLRLKSHRYMEADCLGSYDEVEAKCVWCGVECGHTSSCYETIINDLKAKLQAYEDRQEAWAQWMHGNPAADALVDAYIASYRKGMKSNPL